MFSAPEPARRTFAEAARYEKCSAVVRWLQLADRSQQRNHIATTGDQLKQDAYAPATPSLCSFTCPKGTQFSHPCGASSADLTDHLRAARAPSLSLDRQVVTSRRRSLRAQHGHRSAVGSQKIDSSSGNSSAVMLSTCPSKKATLILVPLCTKLSPTDRINHV